MKSVNLRLPDELAARVDAAAGRRGRNAWLVAAAAEKLDRPFAHRTVGEVLEARGGHVVGRVADVAPPTREHLPQCKCGVCVALFGRAGHP